MIHFEIINILLCFSFSCIEGWTFQKNAPSPPPVPTTTTEGLIRQAMAVSSTMATNITAAYEACTLWDRICDNDEQTPNVLAICFVLQASCLVQIGRDEEALTSFDKAKQKIMSATNDVGLLQLNRDVLLGKASSFQRLLRYEEAFLQFEELLSLVKEQQQQQQQQQQPEQQSIVSKAVIGALTCVLRLGDVERAHEICQRYALLSSFDDEGDANLILLSVVISHLRDSSFSSSNVEIVMEQLLARRHHIAPEFGWILRRLGHVANDHLAEKLTFLELAKINNGPFDDPLLIHMDDKVLLHDLLLSARHDSSAFWPRGMVLPDVHVDDNNNCFKEGTMWIAKERSGYGSHGNRILRNKEQVHNLAKEIKQKGQMRKVLLQRIIEPSLLLDGCKFSLRVYVVYFMSSVYHHIPDVYVSRLGLVKLATEPYDAMVIDDDDGCSESADEMLMKMYLTNSGREIDMRQESLDFLANILEQQGHSFDDFWKNVVSAIRQTMIAFHEKAKSLDDDEDEDDQKPRKRRRRRILRERLAKLVMPKILGFDFVVDANNINPWIVEVNRFPGMEPRDDQDAFVKHSVVFDAWQLAEQRANNNKKDIGKMVDIGQSSSCLDYVRAAKSSLEYVDLQ